MSRAVVIFRNARDFSAGTSCALRVVALCCWSVTAWRLFGDVRSTHNTEGRAMKYENLRVDLSDIELEDIEVLAQEGAQAMPEFAASTSNCCGGCTGGTSCSASEEFDID